MYQNLAIIDQYFPPGDTFPATSHTFATAAISAWRNRVDGSRSHCAASYDDVAGDKISNMLGRAAFRVNAAVLAALIFCRSSALAQSLTDRGTEADKKTVVHGVLTRQGPDRRSFWAITDTNGRTWEVIEVSPEGQARFRRLENLRIVAHIKHVRAALRDQVRVLKITADRQN